jgi:DNA-binding response OmpR family regulator
MNILLVEDDEKVGSFVKQNLSRDNYNVQLISDYKSLQDFLEAPPFVPSLLILDRLLGNDDTKKSLKSIKQKFRNTPILFLSALNTPSEKANALDEGADDYMGKPFSLVELQSRIRALLRRYSESQGSCYYIQTGDITIDLKSRNVLFNEKKIDLTPKEFSLLLNFCEHKSRVFSKYQLLDIIWEANLDVESNVIEVNIMNLRRKLEECGSILTIKSKRNVGYWIEA